MYDIVFNMPNWNEPKRVKLILWMVSLSCSSMPNAFIRLQYCVLGNVLLHGHGHAT